MKVSESEPSVYYLWLLDELLRARALVRQLEERIDCQIERERAQIEGGTNR